MNMILTTDPDYRYKVSHVMYTFTPHGTKIYNLKEISKTLRHEQIQILKFFKKKLGCRIIYDQSEFPTLSKMERELDSLLLEYISKFVLCPKCNIPEMTYEPLLKILNCPSCGHQKP